MEWRRGRRSEALHCGLPAHRRSYARGKREQSDLDLARELARRAGTEIERPRKLFSGRELLLLGGAERLRTDDAADARRHGKFCMQTARSVSAVDGRRAGKRG